MCIRDRGDDHRDNYIPDAAQRASEDLNEHKRNIPRSHLQKHLSPDPYNFGIRGEQPEQGDPGRNQKDDEGCGDQKIYAQADAGDFPDPASLTRSVILPHKCGDGDAECAADHPENSI